MNNSLTNFYNTTWNKNHQFYNWVVSVPEKALKWRLFHLRDKTSLYTVLSYKVLQSSEELLEADRHVNIHLRNWKALVFEIIVFYQGLLPIIGSNTFHVSQNDFSCTICQIFLNWTSKLSFITRKDYPIWGEEFGA